MVTEANVNLSICLDVFGTLSETASVTLVTQDNTAKRN